jgi:NAD-dependent DNA ligase
MLTMPEPWNQKCPHCGTERAAPMNGYVVRCCNYRECGRYHMTEVVEK